MAWKDETAIVTTTITTAATEISINATVATAITTAESEVCDQHSLS